jgi:hypothetical protein
MDVVGWIAIVVVAAVVVTCVVVGLISLPDARRYMKIRRM